MKDLGYLTDYLSLTTYRKQEQQGALWTQDPRAPGWWEDIPAPRPVLSIDPHGREGRAHVVRTVDMLALPTDLPDTIGGFDTVIAGQAHCDWDTLQKLSVLLRYSLAPVRWELLDSHPVHFGTASPRALSLCEAIVATHDAADGRSTLYRYLPDHHALELIGSGPRFVSPGKATITLWIVGQLDRCVVPYGEFAACLAPLEAGMVSAQMTLLCRAMNWHVSLYEAPPRRLTREMLGLDHWSMVPLVRLDVGIDEAADGLGGPAPVRHDILDRAFEPSIEAYPDLRDFVLRSEEAQARTPDSDTHHHWSSAIRPPVSGQPRPERDLLDVIADRTSGHAVDGCAVRAAALTRAQFSRLIDDACALMLVQPSDAFHAIGLSMMVSVVAGEKGVVGRYRYRFTSSGIETVQVQSDRPSDRGYYDHLPSEGIAIVINFLADILKCIGAHTDQSFYVMHQAAGVCGHCFALAAARHNMFVRPLRAYSEWRLGALWEPQEQILLQLVSGFPRRASLRFDIG